MPIPSSDRWRVQLEGVSKSFRGVQALKNVSLSVRAGEIQALVGENGAGKSTLMNILSGVVQKDSGAIRVDGELVDIPNPRAARRLGVGIIHQELALAPDLTVAENIFLGALSRGMGIMDYHELNRRAGELLASAGFPQIDPKAKVESLGVAHQQIVEIAKGLSEHVKILILDEPTAVLVPHEVESLFAALEKLRGEGVSIVYISHRLDEIFRIADSITVLKDGEKVRTVLPAEVSTSDLIRLMIGRTLGALFPQRNSRFGSEILRVEGLSSAGKIRGVSFAVREGEIFGIAGLIGSGRTEILRAIFGADPSDAGVISVGDRRAIINSPGAAVRNGLALVPESRKDDGAILSMSVRQNITLAAMRRVRGPLGMIRRKEERTVAQSLAEKLRIKTRNIDCDVADLSGGNQQKVVLAKWLATDCRVLLLDEPTRGVDVGAKAEIYRLIDELAASGMGVVMVSSEMMELIGMCDRVAVVSQGAIAGMLEGTSISEENIMRLAIAAREPAPRAAFQNTTGEKA